MVSFLSGDWELPIRRANRRKRPIALNRCKVREIRRPNDDGSASFVHAPRSRLGLHPRWKTVRNLTPHAVPRAPLRRRLNNPSPSSAAALDSFQSKAPMDPFLEPECPRETHRQHKGRGRAECAKPRCGDHTSQGAGVVVNQGRRMPKSGV